MDNNNASGGSGCLLWLLVIVGIGVGLVMAGGGHTTNTQGGPVSRETLSRNLADNELMSRNDLLSGNQLELMSRNQVNLFSDVQNCWGDGSCPTVIVSNTTTTVGDRNQVAAPASGGLPTCLDPNTGAYTSSACQGIYGSEAGGRP